MGALTLTPNYEKYCWIRKPRLDSIKKENNIREIMSFGRIPIICILSLGALLLPDATDAVCECVKEINDYCCQTPNPQSKDACCHIEGFKQKEPKWICNKKLGLDHECEGDAD